MVNMDPVDRETLISTFCRWLAFREANGFAFPHDATRLECDASHSALLRRLMSGKDPLAEAPPLRWSYPWYSLIEEGVAHPHEVWIPEPGLFEDESIVIDQTRWKIIETLDERDWIMTYYTPDTGAIRQFREAGTWEKTLAESGKPMRLSASRWHVTCQGIENDISKGMVRQRNWLITRETEAP